MYEIKFIKSIKRKIIFVKKIEQITGKNLLY